MESCEAIFLRKVHNVRGIVEDRLCDAKVERQSNVKDVLEEKHQNITRPSAYSHSHRY